MCKYSTTCRKYLYNKYLIKYSLIKILEVSKRLPWKPRIFITYVGCFSKTLFNTKKKTFNFRTLQAKNYDKSSKINSIKLVKF